MSSAHTLYWIHKIFGMHILNARTVRRVRCTLFNRVEEKFYYYHVGEVARSKYRQIFMNILLVDQSQFYWNTGDRKSR